MAIKIGMTFERFLIEKQRLYPEASGEFSEVVSTIMLAGKIISKAVNKAGLAEMLGLTGKINVQGEEVQKLDEFANSTFVKNFEHTGLLCVMASEEEDEIINIPKKFPCGDYVLLFDPLDGSSNVDVNVNIGSIFSIYKRISDGENGTVEDCLQIGTEQVGAGYILYGSSTMLVYSTGNGVDGFTLDPSIGEFLLSHPNITTPQKGKIYSANEGYFKRWDKNVKKYIDHLKKTDKKSNRPYSARYIGSLVADFHRNLLKGGIFLYPADSKNKNGKLRLLYEANPLAYLIEQAEGAATNGEKRILEIQPTELHQRTPLIIGSKYDVEEFMKFYNS